MDAPILYSFRRCPYAMRARLAIAHNNKTVQLREIVLRDKAAAFLEASPKGTVPVLVLANGTVIDESYDVMNWAFGADAVEPVAAELVQACDQDFKPWLDRYKYPNKFEDCTREQAIEQAMVYIHVIEQLLENNKYLGGVERGFADLGIAPFVRQFAHVDKDWFLAQPIPNVIRWYSEFVEWNGFKSIMDKHPKWQPDDPVTVFPSR